MGFAQTVIARAAIFLLCASIAVAQPDAASPEQRALYPLSRYSVVSQDEGTVLLRIPHGAEIPIQIRDAGSAMGVLFELPQGSAGPVEFYVNGALVDVRSRSPFVLFLPELLQPGTWTILAVPDVGYPSEVTYRVP